MKQQNILESIILDLGKEKSKAIKKLKNGEGKLSLDVQNAVKLVESQMEGADKNVKILPVVVIYEKKPKRGKMFSFPMPFPFKF